MCGQRGRGTPAGGTGRTHSLGAAWVGWGPRAHVQPWVHGLAGRGVQVALGPGGGSLQPGVWPCADAGCQAGLRRGAGERLWAAQAGAGRPGGSAPRRRPGQALVLQESAPRGA